jgi:hypothetical protein
MKRASQASARRAALCRGWLASPWAAEVGEDESPAARPQEAEARRGGGGVGGADLSSPPPTRSISRDEPVRSLIEFPFVILDGS